MTKLLAIQYDFTNNYKTKRFAAKYKKMPRVDITYKLIIVNLALIVE